MRDLDQFFNPDSYSRISNRPAPHNVYTSFNKLDALNKSKGYKFKPGQSDLSDKGSLQFYVNEVILGNNTILIELDGFRQSYITYNVLSYLVSKDLRFNQKSFVSFHNLLSRAILISETGEKERNKFFKDTFPVP